MKALSFKYRLTASASSLLLLSIGTCAADCDFKPALDAGDGAGEGEGEGEGELTPCGVSNSIVANPACLGSCAAPSTTGIAIDATGEGVVTVTFGGDRETRIGPTTTRADVESFLGNSGGDSRSPLGVAYCADVIVRYTNAPNTPELVAGILSLPGATGYETHCYGVIGQQYPGAVPPTVSETLAEGGRVRIFATLGFVVISNAAGTVTRLGTIEPQDEVDRWTLPISLDPQAPSVGDVIIGSTAIGSIAGLGQSLSDETIAAAGDTFRVRGYPQLGIQFAGPCGPTCGDAVTISSAAIAFPFLGADPNGARLGSTRAELEATFQEAPPDDPDGVAVYGPGGPIPIGVVYRADDECIERARVMILGYDPLVSLTLFGKP